MELNKDTFIMDSTPQSVDVQEISDTASFQSNTGNQTPTRQRTGNSYLDLASPILSSRSSVSSQTLKTRKFDERLKTRFTNLLNISRLSSPTSSAPSSPLRRITSKTGPDTGTSSLKYIEIDTINSVLFPGHSRLVYGEPTCIAPGDIVAIGTSKGYILIFDYRQNLIHELGKNTKAMTCGTVTCVSLSLDSTHLVAGFENGDVFLWNLANIKGPLAHIVPKSELTPTTEGHMKDSSVMHVSFVGKRHTVIVSSDIHGMVFYHHCHRSVMGFNIATKRILGKYENIAFKSSTIFASDALPLGSSIEYADTLGLMAILSPGALVIVSTTKVVRTQYKTGRPKIANISLGESGCQAWFPAHVLKNGDKVPAKLSYCFSNVLTILEVKSVGDSLHFDSKKRWICDELIMGIQWVNPGLLALITPTQRLILLNERTMKVVNCIDLLSKHLFKLDHGYTFMNSFNSTFKTYKGKLFFIGKYEIFIGSTPNWVDVLLGLINQGQYIAAIETSRKYYLGEEDIGVIDSPLDPKDRHQLVLKYLGDIIRSSANHVLARPSKQQIEEYLYASINTLISINANYLVFEELYEAFKDSDHADDFFQSLEPFILNGDIKTLTPTILKDMVAYYISVGQADTLEQNICLLDLNTLDIDFTISLLKRYNLKDSYIFIWNKILKDYVSPLLELINDLSLGKDSEDASKVYGYLAYVLTGRQYPTEDPIEASMANDVKLTIYYILFNGLPITYENGVIQTIEDSTDGPDFVEFPYLYQLLKNDAKSFLSAMNECLEDSLLNDDEIVQYDTKLKVNRQFIVEVLTEVLASNEFSQLDRLHFAIFIARNYPKFKQFLRLSENLLNGVIDRLCEFEKSKKVDSDKGDEVELEEDCKLSLQSLLSVYQPPNKQRLITVFETTKFYEILIQIYLNDRKYSKVLEVWLCHDFDKKNSIDTTNDVLRKCFVNTSDDIKERKGLLEIIKEKFNDIIEFDTYKIVKTINQFAPKMHKVALDLTDQQLKYMYLKSLFELEKENEYRLSINERNHYAATLSKLGLNEELISFVKTLNCKTDIKLDQCIDDLRQNGSIDALIYLLKRDNKAMESFDEAINYTSTLIEKLPFMVNNKDGLSQLESKIWKYLQIAINLSELRSTKAEMNGNGHGTTPSKLDECEEMWLKLINFIVGYLKKFETADSDQSGKIMDIIKRLIQDLFSTLINSRSQIESFELTEISPTHNHSQNGSTQGSYYHQSSFLKIFTEFLNSSSMSVTLLGDVRAVTNEIYLSLSYEKNILTITSNLINESIYATMERLTDKNQVGWSVKSFECDACGKVIWGRGLSSAVYCTWEDIQRNQQQKSGGIAQDDDDDEEGRKSDLVSFNCRHCYHRSCLEHLGSKGEYTCVICGDENR